MTYYIFDKKYFVKLELFYLQKTVLLKHEL